MPVVSETKAMTPIERVRCACAMADAGYTFDPDIDDVEELLKAYDTLTAALSDQVAAPSEPTPEMAAVGRKALAIVANRMEEAKLLAVSSIDFWQRVGHEPANEIYKAMLAAAPPSSPAAGE